MTDDVRPEGDITKLGFVSLTACTTALVELCEKIATAAGLRSVDGIPVAAWLGQRYEALVNEQLTRLEDNGNPALAAKLKEHFDMRIRQLDEGREAGDDPGG
jgi:hypothetical protein